MANKINYIGALLLFLSSFAFGQGRFEDLRYKLDQAAKDQPGLNNKVDISVNHYTIQEIIRAIAQENGLNVSIDAKLDTRPSYNFANATVKDVFLLLCKEHDLTLEWTGQIISFRTFIAPKEKPAPVLAKKIDLRLNPGDTTISGSLRNDTLFNVIGKLSALGRINIDVAPSLRNEAVSMVIVNQKMEDVLKRLAGSNELVKVSKNFYQIKQVEDPIDRSKVNTTSSRSRSGSSSRNNRSNRNNRSSQKKGDADFFVEITEDSLISVEATEGDLMEIISEVCNQSGKNFFLFDQPKGSITVKTFGLQFEETLSYLLNTSEFTYKKIDSVYIIGDRTKEKFRHTETYQFQYRTIEGIPDFIPADLKKGIEIQESVELNSLILSGSLPQINELKKFFIGIDKVVPMVLIEVMIVDVNRGKTISSGITVDNVPRLTGGSMSNAGINVDLSSSTLNRIIESITDLGFFNLGNVGSNFYANMNALETRNLVKIVSTPKLAAINGHEAELSIGETTYYKEVSNNFVGSQIPQSTQSFVYKPLNADLSVNIKPVVSGDDQITLEISVSQSNFTNRIEEGAPPGNLKREFKSIIRMKNQDMVVLGGLENKRKEDSNSGVPFVNRIPVIKWFFGKELKVNSKSELTIFIRPTVIQ